MPLPALTVALALAAAPDSGAGAASPPASVSAPSVVATPMRGAPVDEAGWREDYPAFETAREAVTAGLLKFCLGLRDRPKPPEHPNVFLWRRALGKEIGFHVGGPDYAHKVFAPGWTNLSQFYAVRLPVAKGRMFLVIDNHSGACTAGVVGAPGLASELAAELGRTAGWSAREVDAAVAGGRSAVGFTNAELRLRLNIFEWSVPDRGGGATVLTQVDAY